MSHPPRRSAGEVLLELLDKVPDARSLEVLLAPENLLRLLKAHGWTDESIRRDLTHGKRLPGELLLEVLARQPDTAVLMRILGNPALGAPGKAPRSGSTPLAGQRTVSPWARLVVGLLLTAPSAWYLFVRLDVLHAAGLIRHFPSVYAVLFGVLSSGVVLIGWGAVGLLRAKESPPEPAGR